MEVFHKAMYDVINGNDTGINKVFLKNHCIHCIQMGRSHVFIYRDIII